MGDVITINTPEARLQFPTDTPVEAIRSAIAEYAPSPEARASALKEWATQHVALERANGGKSTVGDFIRQIGTGTVVGSWLDEANAATASALGQAPYDEAKAYQNALSTAVDKDTGAAGTGAKIVGGVTSALAAPAVGLMRGASMLPKAVNAAATGGLYGLLYGAGEGDTLQERGGNALLGGGIGAGLGAVSAPVTTGIANAAGYVADKFKGLPAALQGFERGAVDRVGRAAGTDAAGGDILTASRQYGPEGMIGDIGPNTRGQIGAIARTPGEGKNVVLDALNTRADAAGGRIRGELDRTLGPEINLPQAIDTIEQRASAQASPLYEQFRQTPIPYTPELERIVETLRNEPSVLRDARRLTNLDPNSGPQQFFANIGHDGAVTIERVPNANEWDYIKRALDGLAHGPSATPNDRRIYGGLARRIRGEIDSALSPNDPSQSVWAQARAISGEGTGLTNALENGRGAFSRGISPDEMGAELGNLSQAERLAYTLGGRQNVRDVMGNASTKWGANDDTAARKLLSSDYAQQKLEILAGRQNAQRLTDRLNTETAFDATRESARGNSVTAAMQASQKEFPNVADKSQLGREIGAQSLFGIGLRGVRAVTDALMGGALSEKQQNVARDAARILTAQGRSRDDIASALMAYRGSKGMTQAGKQSIDRLLSLLGTGPRSVAIDETVR